MKLSGHIYCDGPDCENNQHVGPDTVRAERLPMGWLRMTEFMNGDDSVLAFCGYDCVMKWAAQFDPPESVGSMLDD